MILACSIIALVLSVTLVVGTIFDVSWAKHLNTLSWLGLVGFMGCIYFDVLGGFGAALIATAFGALVAIPQGVRNPTLRRSMGLAGLTVPVALSIAAVVFASTPQGDPASTLNGDDILIYAGHWAALAACLTCALSAVGAGRVGDTPRPQNIGLGLSVLGLLGALFIMGTLRADVPTDAYTLPLSSAQGALYWGLDPKHGGESVIGLRATTTAIVVYPMLGLMAFLAFMSAVAPPFIRRPKLQFLAWGSVCVVALATLGALIYAGFNPTLPAIEAFVAQAQVVGAQMRVPPEIIVQGHLPEIKSIFVMWTDILPDLIILSSIALLTGLTAILYARPSPQEPSAPGLGGLYARDFMVRASMLAWLAWFLGMLASWKMHAVYGFASPSEWSYLGFAILTSGLTWMGFARQPRLNPVLPALAVVAIVLILAVGFALGVPPQSALRF